MDRTRAENIKNIEELNEMLRTDRTWVIQEFIWHLHDDTRWPAKYYKDVINFYLSDKVDPPESIHYTWACRNYNSSTSRITEEENK